MKKGILFGLVSVGFFLAGCGGAQPQANLYDRDGGIYIDGVLYSYADKFSSSNELKNKCSMHTYLYLAARETLQRGYKYFALSDPGYGFKYDNNIMGFPIVSSDAYERYCNPALREPDTGLEDDKCQGHHLGSGIATYYKGHIKMFKKPNYLFPTWDAAETLRKEEPKVNECIDWSKYDNASSAKDILLK